MVSEKDACSGISDLVYPSRAVSYLDRPGSSPYHPAYSMIS
jgi:hypothetical protein